LFVARIALRISRGTSMAGAAPNRHKPESMGEFAARRAREQFDRFSGAVSGAAHDAYGKFIRAGGDIHLPTTDDVLAFGADIVSVGRSKPKPPAAPAARRGAHTANRPMQRPAPQSAKPASSPGRTSKPQWLDELNRNPYVKAAAGHAGMVSGWEPGAVRGGMHMLEDGINAAMFASRAINPGMDYATSPPGQRVGDQVLSAGMAVADYANRVRKNPGKISRDLGQFGHQLNVDLNPFAAPSADTAIGEFQRLRNVGKNQGELALNIAASAAGAEGLQALGAAGRTARSTRYLSEAGHEKAAAYLRKPYKGMGDHSVLPRRLNAPDFLSESPFFRRTFRHESQGGAYLKHVEADPHAYGFRLPKGMGARGWSGKKAGVEKLHGLERIWASTPENTKTLLGGTAGAAGGTSHEPFDEERQW
jgi:hypothetical protein